MKRIAERGAHASGKSGGAGLVQSLGRGLSLLDSLAECPDSHSPQQPLSAARLVALDGAPTADHPRAATLRVLRPKNAILVHRRLGLHRRQRLCQGT